MAYERDHDGATRGAGAIAAIDHAASSASRRRRIAVGQATRQRDRRMAAISAGALGITPTPIRSPQPGNRSGIPVGAPVGIAKFRLPPVDLRVTAGNLSTAMQPGGYVPPPPPALVPIPVPPPPPVLLPPPPGTTPTSPLPAPKPPTPTVVTVSSGGGASASPPRTSTSTSVLTSPALPDIPDPVAGASLLTPQNLMIAGGAALAAYLLFFRRRSP